MPHGFVARVVAGESAQAEEPLVESMWEPGRPLPQREKVVRLKGGAKSVPVERVCFSCGHRTESLSAVTCPLCGGLL